MDQGTMEEKLAHVEWLKVQADWAAMTLPKHGTCTVDDKTALMDQEYFKELGEYSASLPSGTYIGKRWKRNQVNSPHWLCSGCGKECVGWASEPFACLDANSVPPCKGTLKLIEKEPNWWMGEYYEIIGNKNEIGIKWRKIEVI
jgi:hypothetical protein